MLQVSLSVRDRQIGRQNAMEHELPWKKMLFRAGEKWEIRENKAPRFREFSTNARMTAETQDSVVSIAVRSLSESIGASMLG